MNDNTNISFWAACPSFKGSKCPTKILVETPITAMYGLVGGELPENTISYQIFLASLQSEGWKWLENNLNLQDISKVALAVVIETYGDFQLHKVVFYTN